MADKSEHAVSDAYLESTPLPDLKVLNLKICYICGGSLSTLETTSDHLIPDNFYKKGSLHRPRLPVHRECNNSKSKDDRWFSYEIRFLSNLHPEASHEIEIFLENALMEKASSQLFGKSKNIKNYKLAMTLLEKIEAGDEKIINGQKVHEFTNDPSNRERLRKYAESMCRGLFIRNVPNSVPRKAEIIILPLVQAELDDSRKTQLDAIKQTLGHATFSQCWGERLFYCGGTVVEDRNKGFICIQFFRQVLIMAFFA